MQRSDRTVEVGFSAEVAASPVKSLSRNAASFGLDTITCKDTLLFSLSLLHIFTQLHCISISFSHALLSLSLSLSLTHPHRKRLSQSLSHSLSYLDALIASLVHTSLSLSFLYPSHTYSLLSMGHSRPLLHYLRFSIQLIAKKLPTSRIKLQISSFGIHHSTNWATTTAQTLY